MKQQTILNRRNDEIRNSSAGNNLSGEFRPSLLPDDAFEIRPVNSDNQRELGLVIDLLRRYQGQDVLARGISDAEFLYSHFSDLESDEKLVSMLIFHQNHPVAHAALRFQQGTECPEIVLPAIDPDYQQYLVTFSNLFWEKIQHLAARQSWEMIYQFSPVSDAALQIISAKHFDALEMAVLPDPSPARDGARHPNRSTVLLVHLFQNRIDRPRYLYPPQRHAQRVAELYEPLDAKRIVVELADQLHLGSIGQTGKELVDRTVLLRLSGFEERRIVPSECDGSCDAELETLCEQADAARQRSSNFWVRVALDDKATPAFCERLEERGFLFCGVFPVIQQRDWILYASFARESLPVNSLRTPRGRNLVNYLLNQGSTLHSQIGVERRVSNQRDHARKRIA